GAGLERVTAVLQGVISNYDTDLFVPLIRRAAELCGVELGRETVLEKGHGGAASLRVIADHARAMTFLIGDGVVPSNEGRGYVLRKIMRRGILHGRLLGQEKLFFAGLVSTITEQMAEPYPELVEATDRIARVVEAEERQFARVLENGLGRGRELVGNVGMQHVDKSLKELLDERKNSSELQYYQDELPRHIRSISPGVLRDFYFGNVEPLRYFVGSQLGPGRADEVVNSLREKV